MSSLFLAVVIFLVFNFLLPLVYTYVSGMHYEEMTVCERNYGLTLLLKIKGLWL